MQMMQLVNITDIDYNNLQRLNNRQTYPDNQDNNKKKEREGAGTLLYSMQMY